MASAYLRAGLALAAGAALLTTSTSGYAAWQQAHAATTSGMSLESGPAEISVTPAGGRARTIDPAAEVRLTVGDTLTVQLPVTLHTGGAPQTQLTVAVPAATGDPALVKELTVNPTPLEVTPVDGGPELSAVAGHPMHRNVPAGADGHTYLVRWSTSTRTTRDGRPAGSANAWGSGPTSLQGLGAAARSLTVSLQVSPGGS